MVNYDLLAEKHAKIERYMENPKSIWDENREKYPTNQIDQTESLIKAAHSYKLCYICGTQENLLYIENLTPSGEEIPGIHCQDCSEIQEEMGINYLTNLPFEESTIESLLQEYTFKMKKGIVAIVSTLDNKNKGRTEQYLLKEYPELFNNPENILLFYGKGNDTNIISDELFYALIDQTKASNKNFNTYMEKLERKVRKDL